ANGGQLRIGRDLNFLNVTGNVVVENGSTFAIDRDLGLIAQAAKGTDPGGQGGVIQGNLEVQPGGSFLIGRSIDAPFLVNGSVTGTSRIVVHAGAGNFQARGGFFP